MATTAGVSLANLNGTTTVDIVAAPAASTRRQVASVSVHNRDTVAAEVTITYNDNGTTYVAAVETLQPKERASFGPFVLDATTRKLQAALTSAITTTNPTVISTWADQA